MNIKQRLDEAKREQKEIKELADRLQGQITQLTERYFVLNGAIAILEEIIMEDEVTNDHKAHN